MRLLLLLLLLVGLVHPFRALLLVAALLAGRAFSVQARLAAPVLQHHLLLLPVLLLACAAACVACLAALLLHLWLRKASAPDSRFPLDLMCQLCPVDCLPLLLLLLLVRAHCAAAACFVLQVGLLDRA
jgi:hypothetical protein